MPALSCLRCNQPDHGRCWDTCYKILFLICFTNTIERNQYQHRENRVVVLRVHRKHRVKVLIRRKHRVIWLIVTVLIHRTHRVIILMQMQTKKQTKTKTIWGGSTSLEKIQGNSTNTEKKMGWRYNPEKQQQKQPTGNRGTVIKLL